ncbi:FtsK/SpoIIIE domain-containing protein [Bacillaceae bacterium W0354]
MLFEIISTASLAAISFSSYFFENKNSANDHEKIIKIADAAGLKKEQSIRIRTRRKGDNYTEYVYQMPLGLSYKQFEDNKQIFIDGLNNKSKVEIDWKQFKEINWDKNVIKQVQKILNKRKKLDKHLEIEYDGMLKFRVYEEGLKKLYPFSDELLQKDWVVPIGYTYKDLITHDFESRPHMIVAGATGFGKSEFLKLILACLIEQKPEHLRLHLIDLKGGNELGPFKDMKQCINFAREPKGAKRILEDIQNDMNNKLDLLFDQGLKDVKRAGQKERDFIIIDEAADLDEDSRDIVVDIARRGRSAGYRLIYATQYPTNETLPSQVRANIGARVCFRLETAIQSRAVLDEVGAEELPEIEGRAIFRRVKNHIVQTPYIEEEQINRIIKPHINVRAKKEGLSASSQSEKSTKTRGDSIVFKEA